MTNPASPRLRTPFHVFRGFLEPDLHASIRAWALANEPLFGQSLLVGNVADPSRRSSRSAPRAQYGPWKQQLRDSLLSRLPALFAAVGMRPFDVSRIEVELVVYNDGDHFHPHIDTLRGDGRTGEDRLLSGVYYFHAEPKGFTGGELRLHNFTAQESEGDYVDIVPEQNSFLLFPSWARHEVRPVACPSRRFEDSRFAINCWLMRART
jgi:SM-20-related protein